MFPVRNRVKTIAILLCLWLTGYIYFYTVYSMESITDKHQPQSGKAKSKPVSYHNAELHNGQKSKSLNKKTKLTTIKQGNVTAAVQMPLLTLFTTWREDEGKYKVWNATLKNWAYFKPVVRPVFFHTNGRQTQHILKHGWEVLPVSKMGASEAPVLKNMFLDVMKKFNSSFYGYANGDILFEEGLITTLRSVLKTRLYTKKPVLISGIRTNVQDMTVKETNDVKKLVSVAEKRGVIFTAWAEDYFIADPSYPWSDLADVVIGRRGYDNYMVIHARQLNHTLIDATQTLMAIHQTTTAGNREYLQHKNLTYNNDLLSKLYKSEVRYNAGATACSNWRTLKRKNKINNSSKDKIEKDLLSTVLIVRCVCC